MDERLRLSPKRNPFYKHSQAAFFLAYKQSSPVDEGTRPIGRLAVLDNRRYNEFNKTKTAFFYLFECETTSTQQARYSTRLRLGVVCGLDKIIGPKVPPLDGWLLVVEHRPAFGLPYNRLLR
jgi:hypothetical protein